MNNSATLTAISGVGAKGPACLLVETGGKRIMLDLGYGPQPGLWPDVDGVGPVDALILSHSHKDHAGGLSLMPKVGSPPIYATDIVAGLLPADLEIRPLPLRGAVDVLGLRVTTGRNGHAPGGIWLYFEIDGGFIYMGDNCLESPLYAYDPPPKARAIVIDASYGDNDRTLADCQEALAPYAAGAVLLPAPEDGRGPEIALHFFRSGHAVQLDDATRMAMRNLASNASECLRDGAAADLTRLAEAAWPIGNPGGAMVAAPAAGGSGETARLIGQWENQPEPPIVFTGYVPPGTPADRLVKSGRGQFVRWNVHPRLSDNVALVRATGAATVVPAFCDRKFLPALQAAFNPANVTMDRIVML